MRSAKVELMARTVADAAVALRTVPAGRKQRTFLCVHYQRARIPDGTTMPDLQDFRCAGALRCDGRRASNWFARAKFTSAADQPAPFAAQRSQLSVYGRGSNRCAGHACSSPAPVEPVHSWTSGGACVHLRCAAFATRPATVELLHLLTCQMQLSTRGDHRSVSASACTMRCDGRS